MKPRQRKCKYCREWYTPFNSLQKSCTKPKCAIQSGREMEQKKRRRQNRIDRERIKTRSQHMREAQQAFNAFIRERDTDLPCISCGTTESDHWRGGGWDCGHYRSVGAHPELRFEELNAAKQCKRCNSHLSGNVVDYRIGLRERIGDEKLAWLEGHHEPKRYTIDDLRHIKAHYREKLRRMRKGPTP